MTRFSFGLLFTGCIVASSVAASEKPVGELIAALKDKQDQYSVQAAQGLAEMGPGAASAVKALQAALKDDSPAVRAHAARALGLIGPASKPAATDLSKLLVDERPEVRRAALQAIQNIRPGPDVMIPLLTKVLREAPHDVRAQAIESIAELGEAAVEPLIEALKHKESRYWACLALNDMGPKAKKAVPELLKAAADEQPQVRMHALLAVAATESKDAEVIPVLRKALGDPVPAVRYAATFAAAQMGTAASSLAPAVEAHVKHDDEFLRTASAWAAAKLKPDDAAIRQRAITMLLEGVQGSDRDVRRAATKGLFDLRPGEQVVVKAVTAVMEKNDPELIADVVEALSSLGDAAVPRAIEALKNENLRPVAAMVLNRLGPKSAPAIPALVEAMKTETRRPVLREIAFAIASHGPAAKDAVPILIGALDDEEILARCGATFCLGKIGPEAKAAIPKLQKNLDNEDPMLKLFSAWALVRVEPNNREQKRRVAALFVEALKSDDPLHRTEAAESLGLIGPDAPGVVVPALREAVRDRDPAVRDTAQRILKQLGEKE